MPGWHISGGGGGAGGSGDVVGPAASTDNAIARWDLATGKLLQDSSVLVPDGLSGTVVVGSTGATDDAIIIADGVGGATVAASAATLTAAGSLVIPAGQTLTAPTVLGGSGVSGNLTLQSTSNGTKGQVIVGASNAGEVLLAGELHLNHAGSNYTRIKSNGTSGIDFFSSSSGTVKAYIQTSDVYMFDGSNQVAALYNAGNAWAMSSDFNLGWSNSTTTWNPSDTGLARNAAAVVRVTNGSTGIGSLLSSVLVEANTAGSGTPNAIAATESGTVFTNEGATAANYHTLPSAAAGYQFTFIVQDADGIRIVANTDDTIRVIDKVTAAAGYIESTTIGSTVTLVSINAVEWYAISINGVWTDGTFTYDDTSLTTP